MSVIYHLSGSIPLATLYNSNFYLKRFQFSARFPVRSSGAGWLRFVAIVCSLYFSLLEQCVNVQKISKKYTMFSYSPGCAMYTNSTHGALVAWAIHGHGM